MRNAASPQLLRAFRRPAQAAALASGLAFLLPISAGRADRLPPTPTQWLVTSMFEKDGGGELKDQPRTNLSGAACVPTTPPFTSCLIANDEKKYAQFFSIEGTNITPRALIRLIDKDAKGDPDAEGVAYEDGYFYVAGSHGRSRGGKRNKSSYVVFRIPVDTTSGKPKFQVSEDEVVGVEPSGRLRKAIRDADTIKEYYDKKLAKGGVNFEGIAVQNGRMYLGLRGPSRKKHAFILNVDAKAVFTPDANLDPKVRRLALGKNTGIRDLAAVHDGLLILSGPVNDQDVTPALFHWSERSGLRKLGDLQLPAPLVGKAKAEILLVLRDQPSEPWRLLVMFDGPENGAPTEYQVSR